MRIITCFKVVPDDQEIVVNSNKTLDVSKAPATISSYDLNALEAGVALAEAVGAVAGTETEEPAEVVALSVGGAWIDESKLKKNVLSRGPDELVLVADDSLADMDSHATAAALKAALNELGSFDLVICGEGSADRYAQQVGIQLGMLLDVPVLNCVTHLECASGSLLVERTLENEVQSIELSLPAVISVTSDLNKPRIAGMKQILAAGKKPSRVLRAADLGFAPLPSTEVLSTLAPPEAERLRQIVEGSSDEEITAFAKLLAEALR
jgi:electron transfer flavoprotein beta subunit